MKSFLSQWIVPVLFGLATASLIQPLLVMVLMDRLDLAQPFTILGMPLVVLAVAWILARHVAPAHRIGWGCIIIGISIAVLFTISALMAGAASPSELDRDAGGALVFFFLIFGIPAVLATIILIGGGVILLRRAA